MEDGSKTTDQSKGTTPYSYFGWKKMLKTLLAEGRISPTTYVVLDVMADFGDYETGENVRPLVATLARRTHLSERTVKRALAEARALGCIYLERHGGGTGANAYASVYSLTMPGTEATGVPSSASGTGATDGTSATGVTRTGATGVTHTEPVPTTDPVTASGSNSSTSTTGRNSDVREDEIEKKPKKVKPRSRPSKRVRDEQRKVSDIRQRLRDRASSSGDGDVPFPDIDWDAVEASVQ